MLHHHYYYFTKVRGTKDHNCQHLLDHRKSRRVPEKHLLCFTDCAKAFDCVDHNKLWKILKEMGIPDHLTYLLRNPSARRNRTEHGTMDWFQIGKRARQGCMLLPLFILIRATKSILLKCNFSNIYAYGGLPWWLSGTESTCQCKSCWFDPWVGKIPWRRKWQPTPVFHPGKPHRPRSLAGYC